MSGVYKLINVFLFFTFAILLAVLTRKVSNVEVGPLPGLDASTVDSTKGPASETAPAPTHAASAQVSGDFGEYRAVVDNDLFTAERKPYVEVAQVEPPPEPAEEPTPEPGEMDFAGLQLTGVFIAGATKLAFFNESGASPGPMGPSRPGPNGAPPNRLQRHLQEQQRKDQALKIQEAMRASGQMPPAGSGMNVGIPGLDGQPAGEEAGPPAPRHGYHEGEEVQGFKIESIRHKDVMLSKDGQQGALKLTPEAGAAGPAYPQQGRNAIPQRVAQQQLQEQQRRLLEQQRRMLERRRRMRKPVDPSQLAPPLEEAEEVPTDAEVYPTDEELEGDEVYDDEIYEEEESEPAPVKPSRPRKLAVDE